MNVSSLRYCLFAVTLALLLGCGKLPGFGPGPEPALPPVSPDARAASVDASQAAAAAIETLISETHARAKEERRLWDTVLFPPRTKVEEVKIEGEAIRVVFSRELGDRPWSAESAAELETALRETLAGIAPAGARLQIVIHFTEPDVSEYQDFDLYITSPDRVRARQTQRTGPAPRLLAPVVDRAADSPAPAPDRGLLGRNIAVAPSHGWTWHKENRWQFQRAYLFTMIEDLYPNQYVAQFLAPMLENAGAVVWNLRERDFQSAEVIVDNEGADALSTFRATAGWTSGGAPGWKGGRPAALDATTEPFTLGSHLRTMVSAGADSPTTSEAVYIPYIPRDGRYAVYLSWAHSPRNSPSVPVRIRHLGGETTVRVNQQAAGGTWVLLGFYEFAQGADEARGSLAVLAGQAAPSPEAQKAGLPTIVTCDAARFGGGMGNIAPGGLVSGYPRWAEAGRYWMQYAGAPAESVYFRETEEGHFGKDYIRDYVGRPEWANYLNGAPNGPTKFYDAPGLGVPVDLYFSWHTDAGISEQGLTGTLAIYRVEDTRGQATFPDGRSRWLNRDLMGLMQEEIIRTARDRYTSQWPRRQLTQGRIAYAEAKRANVPSCLLELLSHQNFNDMKYGLDPRWQRDISRAIYKAIARFIAWGEGYEPVFTPLEPTHLSIRALGNGSALLTWRAQPDPLEPSAAPDGFVVYRSADGRGFDNGVYVTEPRYTASGIEAGKTAYFRVAAANRGGISFPSAVVAVRWAPEKAPALIVDGFDRLCGPAVVEEPGARGFDRASDPGVYYQVNSLLVGDQFDFDPKSKWQNDLETCGWGGSHRDLVARLEVGNTFDHIVKHAKVFEALNLTFDSCVASAFAEGRPAASYALIDWIAGRQKATPPPPNIPQGAPDRMTTEFSVFSPAARQRLEAHLAAGGKLFLSGAHIAEDLTAGPLAGAASREFAQKALGVAGYTAPATRLRAVRPQTGAGAFSDLDNFRFGRDFDETIYPVVSCEAFQPAPGGAAQPALQYADTGLCAALAGPQVALLGFPLETVLPAGARAKLLAAALEGFGTPPAP